MLPDTKFIVAVAVVGCFFGVVLETWLVLAIGVAVVTSVYAVRKLCLPWVSTMSSDSRRRGQLIIWGAVALLGLVLVGCAFWLSFRAGGGGLVIVISLPGGIAGLLMVDQGVRNVRRLTRKRPNDVG